MEDTAKTTAPETTPAATAEEQTANPASLFPGAMSMACNGQLCHEWGWVAFRGVLAVLFGVLAMIWPLATIWTLALLWGAFAFLDGVSAGVTSWRLHKRGVRWWPYLIFAVVGVAAGVAAFLWPGITAMALMFVIAFWAIFGGISQIIAAIRLRHEIEGEWFLAFAGIVSVLFGLLILLRPVPQGILAIAWMVGFYAMVTGTLLIMLALKLRKTSLNK